MKCQYCDNTVSQHITELDNGKLVEYHVCEEHAKNHASLKDLPQPKSRMLGLYSDAELNAALIDQDATSKIAACILPALCLALEDDCAEVRVQAAFRLMMLGKDAESALNPLNEALVDEDKRVQKMARAAIDQIERGKPGL